MLSARENGKRNPFQVVKMMQYVRGTCAKIRPILAQSLLPGRKKIMEGVSAAGAIGGYHKVGVEFSWGVCGE